MDCWTLTSWRLTGRLGLELAGFDVRNLKSGTFFKVKLSRNWVRHENFTFSVCHSLTRSLGSERHVPTWCDLAGILIKKVVFEPAKKYSFSSQKRHLTSILTGGSWFIHFVGLLLKDRRDRRRTESSSGPSRLQASWTVDFDHTGRLSVALGIRERKKETTEKSRDWPNSREEQQTDTDSCASSWTSPFLSFQAVTLFILKTALLLLLLRESSNFNSKEWNVCPAPLVRTDFDSQLSLLCVCLCTFLPTAWMLLWGAMFTLD